MVTSLAQIIVETFHWNVFSWNVFSANHQRRRSTGTSLPMYQPLRADAKEIVFLDKKRSLVHKLNLCISPTRL